MSMSINVGNASARPRRHDLVSVARDDWSRVAATRPAHPTLSSAQAALVAHWGDAGWPVIVRRATHDDAPGGLPIGLPQPPSLGKARVALSVPAGVPWRRVDGVALADVRHTAPVAWREAIDAIVSLGHSLALVPHVFGALLWQSVTGMAYLNAASDLDLLWTVADAATLAPLLEGLTRIEAACPVRIDGEVLTPDGGINWRELAAARQGGAEIVLIKSTERAGFVPFASLFPGEAVPCC